LAFVTGHAGKGGEPGLDWAGLSKANQTVVIYMGLSMAPVIAGRMLAAGRDGATPALIVENASRADERRIVTTLAGLAAAAEVVAGPALLIVGEAMALAQAGGAAPQVETLIREARA
jgi:uroporphyrin-III C-methyltransferase